jgi:hypothetical protein
MTMPYGRIYGLYHPRTGELRYLGQTVQTLKRRLALHMCSANLLKANHSARWLASLVRQQLKPRIEELSTASSREELDRLEVAFIAKAKTDGVRLTNHTDGGEGQSGRVCSEATKAKIAATKRGMPSPRKGVKLSVETRLKISLGKRGNQCRLRQDVSTDSILQGIRDGKSLPQIAAETGVDRHTVLNRYNQAAQSGVPVPELNPTMFQHTEDARRRIGQAQLGCRRSEVTRAKISAAKTKLSTELLLSRLAEGVTVRQLSFETGVDRSTIYLRLKQLNLGVP